MKSMHLRASILALLAATAGCDSSSGEPAGGGVDASSSTGHHDTTSGPAGSGGSSGSSTTTSGSSGTGGTIPVGGCFAPGEVPPSASPAGFPMPSLDDERNTYTAWGLTWMPEAEPVLPADPSYEVENPDIHGATEADDLWNYLMMWQRTGQPGYQDRAAAWATYFAHDYRACVGSEYEDFCFDRDAYGGCHMWGWGLVAWSEAMGDPAALDEAEQLAGVVEALHGPGSSYTCYASDACFGYGPRGAARHLLLVTRVAELTNKPRWISLRDQIIDRMLAAPEWDAGHGMYFVGEWETDQALGAGAYATGVRIQSAFQVGVLGEALDHAYRTTGRQALRDRMVAMAAFVDAYGLDPVYDYTASWFGVKDGQPFHSYAAEEPVTYWAPVYTTSLVNTLVRGYRYTCDAKYYDRARHFHERGNRGVYGEPTMTASPEGTIHHFVDSVFDSSYGNFYLSYNKGELQYTYLLFNPR
jgi:hypothetical protein